jgi:rifampin ADP-ribosylating transferase
MTASATVFLQSYFHGTRANLAPGDAIEVGFQSNFREVDPLSWVYFSGTLDAAIWGAELAVGSAPERIYVVEPTGPFVDDPNLTDKKFPGNPSLSYRSRDPLRIIGEVTNWQGHSAEQIQQMKEGLARLAADGSLPIID